MIEVCQKSQDDVDKSVRFPCIHNRVPLEDFHSKMILPLNNHTAVPLY